MMHAVSFRALHALSLLTVLTVSASPGAGAQDRTPYELNAIFAVTGPAAFIGGPAAQASKRLRAT
jgi:hypothetical protein